MHTDSPVRCVAIPADWSKHDRRPLTLNNEQLAQGYFYSTALNAQELMAFYDNKTVAERSRLTRQM
jgi:hypothetical protein